MTIIHLSLSPLQFDARVQRELATLRAAGFEATVLAPGTGLPDAAMTVLGKARSGLVYPMLRVFGEWGAAAGFWSFPQHRRALAALLRAAPDAIHAHDWDALAIGAAAGRRLRVPVIYDSHEYAGAMHAERRLWRLVMSPAIRRIERRYAPACCAVITVSEGIADSLRQDLRLAERPVVLRNLPDYKLPGEGHCTGPHRILHYHGILARGRGIERLVAALALLPPHFRLQLLGPERQRGFIRAIHSQALALGVGARVSILPPVAPERLVEAAAAADFGFCLLDEDSPHNRLALPNKVFEYIMAGLFTVVSSNPEMAGVVHANGAGAVLGDLSPSAVAAAVSDIGPEQLRSVRRANLATAKRLNWGAEAPKLVRLYGQLGLMAARRPSHAASSPPPATSP